MSAVAHCFRTTLFPNFLAKRLSLSQSFALLLERLALARPNDNEQNPHCKHTCYNANHRYVIHYLPLSVTGLTSSVRSREDRHFDSAGTICRINVITAGPKITTRSE